MCYGYDGRRALATASTGKGMGRRGFLAASAGVSVTVMTQAPADAAGTPRLPYFLLAFLAVLR